jgi:hypothetical protein
MHGGGSRGFRGGNFGHVNRGFNRGINRGFNRGFINPVFSNVTVDVVNPYGLYDPTCVVSPLTGIVTCPAALPYAYGYGLGYPYGYGYAGQYPLNGYNFL